jgi:uncharacterized protein YdhG (YjbR/CyaY superfamily)
MLQRYRGSGAILRNAKNNFKESKSKGARDVDTYLADLPNETRAVLEKLRETIKAAAPKADEVISYQIPTFRYHGPLVHFAALEKHCSFIVVSKSIMETFESELKLYTFGRTIHFSPENPLPTMLV